ncbi:hypothetical protein [Paenibacillus sedimenti]|nr:hypothetical protein [Paenibacillus sedimenti]
MLRLTPANRIAIYISAGFATAPSFLDDLAAELVQRFKQAGWSPRIAVHFPYGDWSRKRVHQLHEIGSDLWRSARQGSSVYGGKSLYDFIAQGSLTEEPLLLIGHSGGAVASVQAAEQLRRERRTIVGVVQIGSPKCFIPDALKERVLYIKAVNQAGKPDPVPILGTWGGWVKGQKGFWRWDRLKNAPVHRTTLSILGGHADYFRDHEPYITNGSSNLQTITNTIWSWLQSIYPPENTLMKRKMNMIEIMKANLEHSKEDGYVGHVEFTVEGHAFPYEITLQSKSRKDWSYALNFSKESGKEEDIDAVEDLLEEDEYFDQLVDAALKSLG